MIHLSDGYAVSVDSRCYTVGIPRSQTIDNKKTGETKETTIMTDAKYYTSLDKALVGWWQTMRNKELSNFDGSLDEAIEVIKKQDEKIKNISTHHLTVLIMSVILRIEQKINGYLNIDKYPFVKEERV